MQEMKWYGRFNFCPTIDDDEPKVGRRRVDYKAKVKARLHRKFVRWQKRHAGS